MTAMPATQAASASSPAATTTEPMPAAWAAATSDMTPVTVRTAPSSASSPSSAVSVSRLASGSWPDAARMPMAMATS
jgi:hypothetical protein